MRNMKNVGYTSGEQRSFAPSVNAAWVDEFNKVLFELNQKGESVSRNKLTEKLIEDGLKYNNLHPKQREVISFKTAHFNAEELNILKSEVGLDLVRRAILRLLDEGRGNSKFAKSINKNDNEDVLEKAIRAMQW